MNIGLIFPNQLFKDNPLFNQEIDKLYLLEDPLFFYNKKDNIKFHKLKLVLHRASMKFYENFLLDENYKVDYVEYKDNNKYFNNLDFLPKSTKQIFVIDPVDYYLNKRLRLYEKNNKVKLSFLENPNFLTNNKQIKRYFESSEKKKFKHSNFYIWQRKRLNILVKKDGKPVKGKWSFDAENRKKIPKDYKVKKLKTFGDNRFVDEAIEYVSKNFPNHPGNKKIIVPKNFDDIKINDSESFFLYPTNFDEAESWLADFLENRLEKFGDFEDAVNSNTLFINHSVLTPMLNIGLIDPKDIVDKALTRSGYKAIFNKKFKKQDKKIPINSLEGFLRQIIGWREFMRIVYTKIGSMQRSSNFFNHAKKIDNDYYEATTGTEPIDNIIKKLNSIAYSHHIERLMFIGNFMLLEEIDPKEVYRWFMEMYIDSYDWVMVPNVYGMSQFADGGEIITKPYFSSSNYIAKMSDYGRSKEWAKNWDDLFWKFLKKHKKFLSKNPRMRMLINKIKN